LVRGFQLPKERLWLNRKLYRERDEARAEVFADI
jgi:hypothetical protein